MFFSLLLASLTVVACTQATKTSETDKTSEQDKTQIEVPQFSADSAYLFVQQQVDFGARVPNSAAHKACGDYLENKLREYGAEVTVQRATLTAFDGTKLDAKNIIGAFNPNVETRILLFAHWDTRPWADHDANENNRKSPVLGANDGASGVGVLLEMARLFAKQKPSVGIDIIFFDAEDYGAPEDKSSEENADSWCLGSQYWAKNKHKPGYRAKYGILLDMVGAPQAKFHREQISDYYASHIVDKVWKTAETLGFANYFINQPGGGITDDHLYVNQIAGIPAIDIIQYDPNSKTGFGAYWHTANDTMENIDKNTLKAVGETLMHIVYQEK